MKPKYYYYANEIGKQIPIDTAGFSLASQNPVLLITPYQPGAAVAATLSLTLDSGNPDNSTGYATINVALAAGRYKIQIKCTPADDDVFYSDASYIDVGPTIG